ncbi:MAG: RNA polymerase sporulation sigma factor SigE, partial [Paraclostridium sp.]
MKILVRLKTKCISYIFRILSKLGLLKPKGLYYLGGVNILPPPLSSKEEAELLQSLENDESIKTILIER